MTSYITGAAINAVRRAFDIASKWRAPPGIPRLLCKIVLLTLSHSSPNFSISRPLVFFFFFFFKPEMKRDV